MNYRVGIPIYHGVDLIDVAAPLDILSRVPQFWKEGTFDVQVVGKTLDPVPTWQKAGLQPTATFRDYEKNPMNVLLVPGSEDTSPATNDKELMAFIKEQAKHAKWVTSVCTGAMVLAAAGLLDGYQCTTHWAVLDALTTTYPKALVVNGFPRYVRDRNRFTSGGVSSSLDSAVELVSLLTNEHVAKCCQLIVQYQPDPPFNSGDPAHADYVTWATVMGKTV